MGEEFEKTMKIKNYVVANILGPEWPENLQKDGEPWQPWGYPFSHKDRIYQAFVIYEHHCFKEKTQDVATQENNKPPYTQLKYNMKLSYDEREFQRKQNVLNSDLNTVPIHELELLIRTSNCLKAESIFFIGQLIEKREKDFDTVINFGKKSLTDVKDCLANFGLKLKD